MALDDTIYICIYMCVCVYVCVCVCVCVYLFKFFSFLLGIPWSLSGSEGKEYACSGGDWSSMPGSGRSPKEENGNQPQYFFFFNLSILLESPTDGGAWQATVHGVTKSRTWLSNVTFPFLSIDRLLQDIEYSPLCYTVDLYSLLILDMCMHAGVLSC